MTQPSPLLTVLTLVGIAISTAGSVADARGRGAWERGESPRESEMRRRGGRLHRIQEPPTLWRVRRALPAPKAAIDLHAAVIDVAAAAAMDVGGLGDLDPNVDVQITPELVELAQELGSVQAMYEFVRNEFEFQAYFGSQKGSVETWRQRSGNDYDLASLLIALLRSSGVPARYAEGEVELTVAQATRWMAVDDPEVAASMLFTNGLDGTSVVGAAATDCCVDHGTPGCDDSAIEACVCAIDEFCCTSGWDQQCADETVSFGCGTCESTVVAVRAQRVWVETFTSIGFAGPTWVPLDPSFKSSEITPGIDIPEAMALDAVDFIDDYFDPQDPGVSLPRAETPLELLELEIQGFLDTHLPGTTTEDVARHREIVPEQLGLLPSSLPYTVRSRDGSFSEIPGSRRYRIRFQLHDGGTTFIDHTLDLPSVAGRRVTISYEGATPADQATIEAYNGLLYTPPNLIDVRPVLKVGGQIVVPGAAAIGAGRTHSSNMHFLAPTNAGGLPQNVVPSVFNSIIAGELQAIGLSVQGTSDPLIAPADPADAEGFVAQQRFANAIDYLDRGAQADRRLEELLHARVTQDVGDAIVKDEIRVTTDAFGNPTAWEWRGLTVDADRLVIGAWAVDEYQSGCGGDAREILVIGGANGSLNENRIWEDGYAEEAVSTMKILQLAVDQGITVYKRWSTLPLPSNSQPASVRNAISSAIASGHEVTFPAHPITHFNWTGTGYIDQDPCDGAAGYIISGGQNGGSTVDTWVDILWADPFKTVEYVEGKVDFPAIDSPDRAAVFCSSDDERLRFVYQLRVHYTDGSTGAWASRNHRSKSPSQLAPGHYFVIVGDQGTDHRRKLSIVKVEFVTPKGDPATAGRDSGDGRNEFTFSTAAAGTLIIDFKAKTIPGDADLLDAIKDDVVFSVEAIGSSAKAWDAANPGGRASVSGPDLVARVTYTGLPAASGDLGRKKATVECGGKKEEEVTIEVFFDRDASNHPGGQAGSPNFYHYWSQTIADFGTHEWTGGGGTGYTNFVGGSWKAFIQQAQGHTAGGTWGNAEGIDLFAGLTRHEQRHRLDMIALWGAGSGRVAANDLDGDWLPDAQEPTLVASHPYDPSKVGTYLDTFNYLGGPGLLNDVEDYGLRRQAAWTNGSANAEDWAHPGMQHLTNGDADD